MIPFGVPAPFDEDGKLIHELVREAGLSQQFMLREHCRGLEEDFAQRTGAGHAIAVGSGTAAVLVALKAAGVGPDDEVISPAFCCQAVASQVIALGARPVFVDVDPHTLVMDPNTIERRITPRTRVILPAHRFSSMVDMAGVCEVARRYGLGVVEDAGGQHGAGRDGILAGRRGDIGTYSFAQAQVLGGCGEGGMIVTDDEAMAARAGMLRNHGQDGVRRFHHQLMGFNCRMDEIVAGYLRHRFTELDAIIQRLRRIAVYYNECLAPLADRVVMPPTDLESLCYQSYVIQAPQRDALQAHLRERGILSRVYYPRILPQQRAFQDYASPADHLPVSIRVASENLALPIYPGLADSEVEAVMDAVLDFFRPSRSPHTRSAAR